MQDFFNNISRYPRFLITVTLGIFAASLGWLTPLFKKPLTGVALVGLLISGLVFMTFTLKAMLGLSSS